MCLRVTQTCFHMGLTRFGMHGQLLLYYKFYCIRARFCTYRFFSLAVSVWKDYTWDVLRQYPGSNVDDKNTESFSGPELHTFAVPAHLLSVEPGNSSSGPIRPSGLNVVTKFIS